MADHHRTRPADPTTPAGTDRDRSMVPVFTTEMYEAAFSTLGSHPMGGVALARTLEEARQHLADMLIFADPTAPATAEIIAFHRGSPSRTTTAPPATSSTRSTWGHPAGPSSPARSPPAPGSRELDVPGPDQRDRRHRPPIQPEARGPRLYPHLAPRRRALPR